MDKSNTAIARAKHGVLRYLVNDAYVGRSLELYGEFSDLEAGLLQSLIKPGDTVIEVGANIGAHTLHLSKRVGPEGRVIAFEPQQLVHGILVENMEQNGCTNVQAICAGAGDRAGVIVVPPSDYAKPGNFGAVELRAAGQGHTVPLMTIDSLQLDGLALLKVDVEGMESAVIRGAVETIRRLRPVLYLENDREAKSAELIALVQSLGYRLWWHLPPLYSPRNMRDNRIDVFPGVVSVNMLCMHADRAGRVALREITSPTDQWKAATQPLQIVRRDPAEGQKTVGVVRLGAYGDCIWSSSILPHLKAEGYHVTLYTEPRGEEVLRHDPNIDRIVVQDHVPPHALHVYWKKESQKFDRWINLTESVEKNMLAIREDLRFYWPAAARRAIFGGNYLEHVHMLAGVPPVFAQRFYETPDEVAYACSTVATIREQWPGPIIVLAAAGSSPTKSWPHIEQFAQMAIDEGSSVVILGDTRDLKLRPGPRLLIPGTDWQMRQALAFAKRADAVIGQETGILNAVAMEPMRKVVLLTHSTPHNLTKHWINTVALSGAAPCYPCHQIHQNMDACTPGATGRALCQELIEPARVMRALKALTAAAGDFDPTALAA